MTTTLAADELAFLRGICDSPDDDAPRLVLADWLEEHGQGERAEFVRVQCELARIEAGDVCPRCEGDGLSTGPPECRPCRRCKGQGRVQSEQHDALRRRMEALWDAPAKGFDPPPLPGWDWTIGEPVPGSNRPCGIVRRGFVASVTLPLAAFIGGETCGRCRGEGVIGRYTEIALPPLCPVCSGTGTTPGAAAGLRWQPVDRVTLFELRRPAFVVLVEGAIRRNDRRAPRPELRSRGV
jgi:uncharacterized protein (TIGR02996 family)